MDDNKNSYYNELAIAAVTLGAISFVQLIGFEKSITAIVFGVLALRAIKQDPLQKGKNMAIAAIALGVIYTIVALVMLPHAFEAAKKISTVIQ